MVERLRTFICFANWFTFTEWSYNDVDSWKVNYPQCAGDFQSPINIVTRDVFFDKNFPPILFSNYNRERTFIMTNNGHTLQLSNPKKNSYIYFGNLNGIYRALQFHFHWNTGSQISGSEHQINGHTFPLEMHIVHRNVNYWTNKQALKYPNGFAVLGFFFQLSQRRNPEMDYFLNIAQKANEDGIKVRLNLAKLIGLKKRRFNFYRYFGSLTTPPCSEAVIWTIFKKPLKISKKQLRKFWSLKGHNGEHFHNSRPIRRLNDRLVSATL